PCALRTRGIAVAATVAALAGVLATAADAAVRLPKAWPRRFALGLSDAPGHAASLRAHTRVRFRYQYLTGGLNTGAGWATWNPNGAFVTFYVRESARTHTIPVFSY